MKYVAISLLSCVVALSSAHAQIPHIVGNWELNIEALEIPEGVPAPPLQSERRTYYLRDDGYLVGLAVTVMNDGTVNFLQFTAREDGEEYPEFNSATLSDYQAHGTATPMTYAETRIDEYTVQVTDRRDGNVTFLGTRSVSEDGRTMTIEWGTTGPDGRATTYKLVYDRRE